MIFCIFPQIIKLKERLESLNEQLLDPNLESNIKLTKQELEDEIQLNLSLKLRKQSAIKTVFTFKSILNNKNEVSLIIHRNIRHENNLC